jgi:hypothetical protein
LLVRDIRVIDILSAKQSKPHALTPFARIDGTAITYPGEQAIAATLPVAPPNRA